MISNGHNTEVNSNFRYIATNMIRPWNLQMRKLSEISKTARERLASGMVETADWTEWMATDMATLARTVAAKTSNQSLRKTLLSAATDAEGRGILDRLTVLGGAVAGTFTNFRDSSFLEIATHQSDVVRQWGAYAVNEPTRDMSLASRLELTRRFAADPHMSVRECAWMAFRPHFAADLNQGLRLLERVSRSQNPNERRFSIEVSRPRSVWGRHIPTLKERPEMASPLLSNVCKDDSRYVRLAAGNWLNDASKTRPDWVNEICAVWLKTGDNRTKAIVKRGLRTLANRALAAQMPLPEPTAHLSIPVNGGMPC
jgi:3-methyladenine DNA glycosylase AlkC